MVLDAFDVLEASLHPDSRRIELDGGLVVVRTPDRPDDPHGNALHLAGPLGPAAIEVARDDAGARFTDPRTTPRVVTRRTSDEVDEFDRGRHGSARLLDVLVLPEARRTAAGWVGQRDIELAAPNSDRDWHAVSVLQRHAAADDDSVEAAARARGGRDELLRWRVDGRRRQRDQGRARVLLARRFGTPVAAATLVWDPGAEVADGGAGLAALTDLVVHPAHRGLQIATALVQRLVEVHLADFPAAQVATVVPHDLTDTLRRHGWHRHDRLVAVSEPPVAAGT